MFVHHLVTILLTLGSHSIDHFRVGSVIMLVHDASDVWLEAAKVPPPDAETRCRGSRRDVAGVLSRGVAAFAQKEGSASLGQNQRHCLQNNGVYLVLNLH